MDNTVLAKKILIDEIDGAVAWILQVNGGMVETETDKAMVAIEATKYGYHVCFLYYPLSFSSNIDFTRKRISIEVKENRMVNAVRM